MRLLTAATALLLAGLAGAGLHHWLGRPPQAATDLPGPALAALDGAAELALPRTAQAALPEKDAPVFASAARSGARPCAA